MKNYQVILMCIVSGGVFWGIIYGPLPTMLPFAGPENEVGCAVIAGSMCILSLFGIDYKKLINGFN